MDALKWLCLISLKSARASEGLFIDICLERGKYLIAIGGSFQGGLSCRWGYCSGSAWNRSMSARMVLPMAILSDGTLRSFQLLGVLLISQHLLCRGWSCSFSILKI